MSNIEQIDFSTLTWVKTELDETLNRAKDALKAYVEDSEDTNQLQFCVTYLHQIQGTLKMVELYGAAMVAEEMELVAKDLIEGSINDVDSAYDVLMQSILQLPDYLERIELGHKDVPIVLLPLVNDLRAVRSKNLLSESALFNPNLDLGVPEKVLENDVSLKGNQLKTALLKIRSIYEISLLNWFKNPDNDKGLKNMQLVISKLQMILSPEYLKQLFWAYSGLVEGLISKSIDDSVSVKQLAGQVDHLLKELIENKPQTKSSSRAITRNMLYYIGINEEGGRIGSHIKSFFNLSQFIPDQGDIEHAEGSLTGKNKELLQTVSEAINDDVLVVQESLDLFIRNKSADVAELSPLLDNLQKIADTLGILGLGVARDSVVGHQDQIKANVEANERPSDEDLLDVAKTLLMIESQLGDHIQSLGITDETGSDDENAIPKSEQKIILQTLAKESIVNLQQIKTNFVAFIESPWDKHQVEDNPKLLNEIAGAMKILNLAEAGGHVDDIIEYVNSDILGADSKPSALQLEQLATVISSLEYYLENLDQGQRIRENLLSEVGVQIKALVHQASQDIEHNKELAAQKQADDDAMPEQAESAEDNTEVETNSEENDIDQELQADESQQDEVVEDAAEVVPESETADEVEEADDVHAGLVVEFGDDVDDEIKEVFLEEFEEELANMQAGHAQWHENPDDNEEKLTEIRRIFHTLKGSGRLVGAEAIGEFGWQLENMCNRFLDGGIKNTNNFKTVLESGVSMAAVLYQALQDRSVVPNDYDLLLQNAENVTNEQPLQEAAPVAETVEESVEIEDEPIIDEVEELPELDEAEAETLELLDDLEIDESTETDTEDESMAVDELLHESHDEEDSDVAAASEESDEIVEADEVEEEDLSLDYVQYDVEELKEQQQAENAKDATADEASDDAESDDGFTLDDTDIEFDLEDFSLESDTTEQQDDVQVSAEQDQDGENNSVEGIDLDEDEVMDLEAELAELDDEEVIDLEAELAEMDDDIDVDLSVDDVDADESIDSEQDDNEILLELADSEEDGLTIDIDDISFDEDDESDSETIETEADTGVDLVAADEPVVDGPVSDDDLGVDPVFIEILQKEVGSHLTDMSQFVSDCMEKDQPKVNDDFVRVVHTLNGAASMASVDGITQMTTPLEKMSIILLDKKEPLNEEDLNHIEGVIKHAKSQLNLLGTGEATVDESIGQYFASRIEGLREEAAQIKDAEDLAAANNLIDEDVAELDLSDIEGIELDVSESETAEDATAEEETAEDSTAEEETAEEATAEEATAEDATAEEETAEEQTAEEATAEDSTAEEETAEEEIAEDSTAEEATAEEATAEEETAEDETAEEETAEEATAEEATAEEQTAEEQTADEDQAYEPFSEQTESPEAVEAADLDLDDELLEIFSEEATEIFDRADHQLAELEENPSSPAIIQALQRDLHTLKGGARMAGLNQIGDLSHQLESLFESIADSDSSVEPEQQELMSQIMHKLHGMVNSSDYGLTTSIEKETEQLENMLSSEGAEIKEKSKLDEEFFDPLAQVDEPVTEEVTADDDDAAPVVKKKANVLSGGQIKVNSELLDKLVNFAGEVSIYRSRMEQQSAELKLNIDELENTVERVRRQLRELEHETEAQIISNYQLEGDELEEDFDPLELDQFSTIQQLSRSLSESVSDLTNIQTYLQESARSSETLLIQQSRVNTELQEGLMETRLVTFNSLVPRLRRVLRTAAQELDKKAKLSVKGAEGEMDKTVLEGIQAPLEHMIRNAMVHGIESGREKTNKPDQGQIVIELSREATEVVITVSDDGAGINTEVLKKKALERGIISEDDQLSDHDITQLITHSGLSAADKVSKLAGRGVGMDVVNNEVKRLGGSIEIISKAGEGTTFVIRLPYTLALTQAIIVQVADHRYAIPASGVQGLIRMNIDEFRRRVLEGDLGYDYAGEQYQIQELNKLLSVDSEAMVEGNQVPLVMIKSGDQGVALRVDQTYGGREIVVKSVGTQVASVPGIFGATILGDGAVVLILDIIPMHRAYVQKLERLEAEGVEVIEEVEEDRMTTIMVVDDSITMRRAGERMLARNDFEVMTAKDGLDALNKLQEQKPDLMLLDIEMPRMDGFELATNMKASDRFKDIPIIMITSRTGQKHKDRAREIGVERYLGKPYQEIELLDNIKDLLQLEDA